MDLSLELGPSSSTKLSERKRAEEVTQEDVLKRFNESLQRKVTSSMKVAETFTNAAECKSSFEHSLKICNNIGHEVYSPPSIQITKHYFHVPVATNLKANVEQIASRESKSAKEYIFSRSMVSPISATIGPPSFCSNSGNLWGTFSIFNNHESNVAVGENIIPVYPVALDDVPVLYGKDKYPAQMKVEMLVKDTIVIGYFRGFVDFGGEKCILVKEVSLKGIGYFTRDKDIYIKAADIKDIRVLEFAYGW